ncbi:hypothetical protein ACFQS3_20760 [Glycomyces mayteni]|uniref:Secreted protein n=1 Tax=Glycomyces mayteni TaxID=543887 RepID=A0ABW2DDJ1_9ACTN|nr:hypothetical protein GCM10025732_06890 [Glycomyces mayteni]
MRQRVIAALSMLSAVLGFLVLAASPAAAAEVNYAVDADWPGDGDYKDCMSAYGYTYAQVQGCFEPDGDTFWVDDRAADGYGVGIKWRDTEAGRSGYCYHNLGSAKAWAICAKNFQEDNQVSWTLIWDSASGWKEAAIWITTPA